MLENDMPDKQVNINENLSRLNTYRLLFTETRIYYRLNQNDGRGHYAKINNKQF